MNPDEHDELKENDLGNWMQVGLWTFLKQNGSYLLLAAALTFLGFQLWRLHTQRVMQELWTAWADLRDAEDAANRQGDVTKMFDVIDKHKQKAVQAQAYLCLGKTYDLRITEPVWLDGQKLTREESLDKARENYESALQAADGDKLITGWAHMGLAAVDEDKGDWDKARAEYQSMVDSSSPYAGTLMAAFAQERLSGLADRRAAPRLAAMIPPPPQPTPTKSPTLSLPGAPNSNAFPGLFGNPGGSVTSPPAAAPSVAPALPPFSPMGPLPSLPSNTDNAPPAGGLTLPPPGGHSLPGSTPETPAVPATQK